MDGDGNFRRLDTLQVSCHHRQGWTSMEWWETMFISLKFYIIENVVYITLLTVVNITPDSVMIGQNKILVRVFGLTPQQINHQKPVISYSKYLWTLCYSKFSYFSCMLMISSNCFGKRSCLLLSWSRLLLYTYF